MKLKLDFQHAVPFVRVATDVTISHNKNSQTVCASDHRLFYVKSGSAILTVSEKTVRMISGSAFFFLSGTPYRIQLDTKTDMDLIAVNFDMTEDNSGILNCLPLVPVDRFTKADQLELLEIQDIKQINKPIVCLQAQQCLPLFQQLLHYKRQTFQYSSMVAAHILKAILLTMCMSDSNLPSAGPKKRGCQDILNYLYNHYREELTNTDLASVFGYHPSYISQIIRKQTGTSLHQYLIQIRIQKALVLLQTTDISIQEIAHSVGFSDSSYFSQYFKKMTGYPPSKYRAGL